jgi:hypothetical protein
MPKKETDDPIIFAESILDQIIAKHDPEVAREQGKNPAAVALGKRGGARGGHARAKSLSAKKRREIGKKGATSRWTKSTTKQSR